MATFINVDHDSYTFLVDDQFLETFFDIEWAHAKLSYDPRDRGSSRPDLFEKDRFNLNRRTNVQVPTCKHVDHSAGMCELVDAVLPAIGSPDACLVKSLYAPGPSQQQLKELAMRRLRALRGRVLVVRGTPNNRIPTTWQDEKSYQSRLRAGAVAFINALNRESGVALLTERSVKHDSVADFYLFPFLEDDEDVLLDRSLAISFWELKFMKDEVIETTVCSMDAASPAARLEGAPQGKKGERRYQKSLAVQVSTYALESGVPAVVVTTGTAAWLWIRRDVSEPTEEFARDKRTGSVTWDVCTTMGLHRDEPAPANRAPFWQTFDGSLAGFFFVSTVVVGTLKKFRPLLRNGAFHEDPASPGPGDDQRARAEDSQASAAQPATAGSSSTDADDHRPDDQGSDPSRPARRDGQAGQPARRHPPQRDQGRTRPRPHPYRAHETQRTLFIFEPKPLFAGVEREFFRAHERPSDEALVKQRWGYHPTDCFGFGPDDHNHFDMVASSAMLVRPRPSGEVNPHVVEDECFDVAKHLPCVPTVVFRSSGPAGSVWRGVGKPHALLLPVQAHRRVFIDHDAAVDELRECERHGLLLKRRYAYDDVVLFRVKRSINIGGTTFEEVGPVFTELADAKEWPAATAAEWGNVYARDFRSWLEDLDFATSLEQDFDAMIEREKTRLGQENQPSSPDDSMKDSSATVDRPAYE